MGWLEERLQHISQHGVQGFQDAALHWFVRNSITLVAAVSALVFLWAALNPLKKSRVAVSVAVKDKRTPSILLVGPMGSGKTSFFGRVSICRVTWSRGSRLNSSVRRGRRRIEGTTADDSALPLSIPSSCTTCLPPLTLQ